ncbi:MAG: acyl carrier protein [Candidatus Hydrothermarchaeaceae archaeon]
MGAFERVKTIIVKELAVGESEVVESAMLADDLDADSLNKFSICSSVEEEFGIKLDDEETMEIETVGDLVSLINKKMTPS